LGYIHHSKILRCFKNPSLNLSPVATNPSLNLSPGAKNPSLNLSPERGETFAYRIELYNRGLKAPPLSGEGWGGVF
jgi:hypothetical protein